MNGIDPAERREARRYPVRLTVTVFGSGAQVSGVRGHTVDVSVRGLRIVTDADLDHGDDQTIIMDLPERPLVAGIDLVWSEIRGGAWVHGLLLIDVEDPERARLSELLTARA